MTHINQLNTETRLKTQFMETHNSREVAEILKQLDSLMRQAVEWQDTGAVYAYEKAKDIVRSIETTFHHQLQKAREEERERIKAVIENKRIPLFVAVDEDDAIRIFKFNEDLDIVLKAIDHSELDQDNKYKIN